MPDKQTQTRRPVTVGGKSMDSKPVIALATPAEQAEARGDLAAAPPEIVPCAPDDLPDRYSTKTLDRALNANLARITLGVSP